MDEMYFTIAGCNHYFGNGFIEKGMKVKLVKEPDNKYDKEAIQVKINVLGKCGYVENSPYTVKIDIATIPIMEYNIFIMEIPIMDYLTVTKISRIWEHFF